ncbi:MAG: efflux RND transporter periplasmic adaptor subunit [Proteobacteria bacterium]|nr:MAG: efflux RND transporter periplasmic adaptor subunit [Pseudomonadota bacterium]
MKAQLIINKQPMKTLIITFLIFTHCAAISDNAWYEVELSKAPVIRTFQGQVEAIQQATVSAQTNGRVSEIHADVDDYLSAGTVIIEFTNKEQKQAVERARANLEAAKATEKQALASFKRAQSIFERKLISQSEYDQAESQKNTAVAAVKTQQAALETALTQLEYTLIKAPFDGIVTARHIEPGETVNIGMPLMSGLSLDHLRVITHIPESIANNISNNADIEFPDGTIVKSSDLTLFPYADPISKTFELRLNLPAKTAGLFPGMSLKIYFKVGEKSAIMIPSNAIVHRGELTMVYVKFGDKRVPRQIKTGQQNNNMTEVISGLKPGDIITTNPVLSALSQGPKNP